MVTNRSYCVADRCAYVLSERLPILKEEHSMKSTRSISAIILILALLFVGSAAIAENSGGGHSPCLLR